MEPDFWVKDVERSMLETEVRPYTVVEDDIPEPDMVTVFEQCRPIQKLEFYSKALAHIYDTAELTKRITSSGMSAVCLKVYCFFHPCIACNSFKVVLKLDIGHVSCTSVCNLYFS